MFKNLLFSTTYYFFETEFFKSLFVSIALKGFVYEALQTELLFFFLEFALAS
jgi:hypothetical protein